MDENKESIFVIAEAGVNHNGDLERALDLCSIARDSGADAVKFQTWKTEKIVLKSADQAKYQKLNSGVVQTQFDMLKELELSEFDFEKIKNFCDKINIEFLSTPDEIDSLYFLRYKLGLKTIKIGSGEIGNELFLREVTKVAEKVILSTGMHEIIDIANSVNIIRTDPSTDLVLLQCTSSYPCPSEFVHLRVMETLRKAFNCEVGFSDHTLGITASIAAAAMGAKVIEKHFTQSKTLKGPDHLCSLEPKELKEMISAIRTVPIIMGSEHKKLQDCEKDVKKVASKVIVASKKIEVGDVLDKNNLTLIRAGKIGLDGTYFEKLIGNIAKKEYEKGEVIFL